MLASISIKNVALIDRLEIDFCSNMNVISGETGSGKSIMLNALGFVVGDRLDKTLIRQGADIMRVDAIFNALKQSVSEKISQIVGINVGDEILISREYTITGKTSCKINGEIVTTSILKQVSSWLVDIHGQHEHQSLLNRDYQLKIIDDYCKDKIANRLLLLSNYIDSINEINLNLKDLGGSQQDKNNLIDLYRYQLDEIEKANIKENEYEELLEKLKELNESERIQELLNENVNLLDNNPYTQPARDQIDTACKNFSTLASFGDKYSGLNKRLESLNIELEDIIDELHTINNSLNFDKEYYDQIDQRVDDIKTLFRKYGGDYIALKDYEDDIANKLDNLINGEEKYIKLSNDKDVILSKIDTLQNEISKIRKDASLELQSKIEKELITLGMKNARFNIAFSRIPEQYSKSGFDAIDFMFSANLGFELYPLSKIASGGELSRFMLAYKIVVNKIDDIDCLIFDEIDTGISGNIANVVAECMGRLSRVKQLLVVTHLPQICAMADVNYLVEKVSTDTTKTVFKEITNNSLLLEIARLMGLIGEDGLLFAKKLKINANNYKLSLN